MNRFLLFLMTILCCVSIVSAQEPQGIEAFTLTFQEASSESTYSTKSSPDVGAIISSGADKVSAVEITPSLVFKGLAGRGARVGNTSVNECAYLKITLKEPIYIQDIGFSAAGYAGTHIKGFDIVFDDGTNTSITLQETTLSGSKLEFKDYYVKPSAPKKVTSIKLTQNDPAEPFYINAITFYVPKLSISSVGYTTYFNSTKAYVMPENVKGYVSYYDTQYHFNEAYSADDVVPANTALVLKGEQSDYPLYLKDDGGAAPANNDLLGTDTETELDDDSSSYFYALTLNGDSDPESVGFYWMNDDGTAFTNGAHKAYLKLNKSLFSAELAKSAFLFNDSNASGIDSNVLKSVGNNSIYNLCGQRVSENTRGVLIRNGKQYIK